MPASKLSQLLTIFKGSQQPLTISMLAEKLESTPAAIEGMLDHWLRKGKLHLTSGHQECGACSKNGDCAYLIDLPRTYELATPDQLLSLDSIPDHCEFDPLEKSSIHHRKDQFPR